MKTRFLMSCAIVVGSFIFISFFVISENSFETSSKTNFPDNREDLEKVVNSNTDCAIYWRSELYDMSNNKTYDYRDDPIFQECYKALESIKWDSTISSKYFIDDNIEFQVTVTMIDPPCGSDFVAEITNNDYFGTFWQERVKSECTDDGITMKASFPKNKLIELEKGTYYLRIEILGGGYGTLMEKFTIS